MRVAEVVSPSRVPAEPWRWEPSGSSVTTRLGRSDRYELRVSMQLIAGYSVRWQNTDDE